MLLFLKSGVYHPGLETFLKNTTTAIKANVSLLNQPTKPGSAVAENSKPSEWFSIFPIENHTLIHGNWEDKIIWDAEVPVNQINLNVLMISVTHYN